MFSSKLLLTFNNQELTEEYNNIYYYQNLETLKFISFFKGLLSGLTLALISQEQIHAVTILLGIHCFINALIFIVSLLKRFERRWYFLGALLQTFFIFFIVELILNGSQDHKNLLLVFMSVNILCSSLLLDHWISKSLWITVQAEYIILRLFNEAPQFTFVLHLSLIFIVMITFSNDRNQKIIFINKETELASLQDWKLLIDNFLPIHIFIASTDQENPKMIKKEDIKIVYINNNCLQALNVQNSNNVNEQIQNIQFTQYGRKGFLFKQSQKSPQEELFSLPQNMLDEIILKLQQTELGEESTQQNESKEIKLPGKNIKIFGDTFFNLHYKDNKGGLKGIFDAKQITCKWKNKKSVIVLMTEVGEQEQQIKNQEVERFKNKIIDSITHNLKTPLNGILLSCQSLQMKLLDSENLSFVDHIYYNSFLLLNMVNDILDYSRFLKDRLVLDEKEYFIESILEEVFSIMKIQFDIKKLKFSIKDYTKNTRLVVDKNRLIQVLLQFLQNSLKYTSLGDVVLEVKKSDKTIDFFVGDTGLGMSKQLISQLGHLFLNPISTYQQGVGLGFIMCKHLLDTMNPENNLKVISIENQGTQVKFSLKIRNEKIIEKKLLFPQEKSKQDQNETKYSMQTDLLPRFNSDASNEGMCQQIKKSSLYSIASHHLQKNVEELDENTKQNNINQMPLLMQEQQELTDEKNFIMQNIFFSPETLEITDQKENYLCDACDQSHFLYANGSPKQKQSDQTSCLGALYRKSSFYQTNERPTLSSFDNLSTPNKFHLSPHPFTQQKDQISCNNNKINKDIESDFQTPNKVNSSPLNTMHKSGIDFSPNSNRKLLLKQSTQPIPIQKQDKSQNQGQILVHKNNKQNEFLNSNIDPACLPKLKDLNKNPFQQKQTITSNNNLMTLPAQVISESSLLVSSPEQDIFQRRAELNKEKQDDELGSIDENSPPVLIYPISQRIQNGASQTHFQEKKDGEESSKQIAVYNYSLNRKVKKQVKLNRTPSIREHLKMITKESVVTDDVDIKDDCINAPKIFSISKNQFSHTTLPRQTKSTICSFPHVSHGSSQDLIQNFYQSQMISGNYITYDPVQEYENETTQSQASRQIHGNQHFLFDEKIQEVLSSNEGSASIQNTHSLNKIQIPSSSAISQSPQYPDPTFLPQQYEIIKSIQEILNQYVQKILIVDDSPFNLLCLKILFKKMEFQCLSEAHNGQEAIDKVKKEKFDLILMDVNMPIMDGLEATQQIKQLINNGELAPTKIFILTAFGDSQDKKKALSIGADAHISKPITLNSLYHELKVNYQQD